MDFLPSSVVTFCLIISASVFSSSVFSDSVPAADTANKEPEQKTLSFDSTSVEQGAYLAVQSTTARVMKIIAEAQDYFENDPARFYREVELVLDDVVDFSSFARGVMGKYASSKIYRALKTDEEKAQFRARMKRFSSVFKNGLVQTYAMGLLAFEGNKIEILPLETGAKSGKTVTVVQHIYGKAEKPYVVHYKMRRNKSNEWKLRNVTIEAINLGKVYQSQFYSAVKQYKGDIDQVIDNWTVAPADPKVEAS